MFVYFADRQGKVINTASSTLQYSNLILSDKYTDDIETGIKTISLEMASNEKLKKDAAPGNFILVRGYGESLLFNIIEAEYDAESTKLALYAEDAGLDLLNRTSAAWTPTADQTLESAVKAAIGDDYSGWLVEYGIDKATKKGASYFDYTSDDTSTNRLQSIVNIFGCEMYYSYSVNGLNIIERTIHIVKRRGSEVPTHIFRLGVDISKLRETSSIENLVTEFRLYGVDANKNSKVISAMSGYNTYKYDVYGDITPDDKTFSGTRTHTYRVYGNGVRCVDAMDKWKSLLDTDGKITRTVTTNYSNIKTLISYAMSELEKVVDTVVEYTVDFSYIPDGVSIGDNIRIVDERDKLYFQTRLLGFEKSEISDTFSATLGDFVVLKGSKAEVIQPTDVYILSLTSSNGLIGKDTLSTTITAAVYRNGSIYSFNTANQLPDGLSLMWFENGELISSDDPRLLHDGWELEIIGLAEGTTYSCKLNKEVIA